MTNVSNWKGWERELAEKFKVKRNISRGGNFGRSESDTEPHPVFSIEAKKRSKLPVLMKKGLEQAAGYYPEKVPIVGFKEKFQRGGIICIDLDYFWNMYELARKQIFNTSITAYEDLDEELIKEIKGIKDD